MNVVLIAVIIIIAVLILVFYGFAAYAVRGKRYSMTQTAEIEKKNFPDISNYIDAGDMDYVIEGFEGYKIYATLYKSASGDGKKYMIITHGHTYTRHGSLKYMPMFLKRGYNCIVYDLRGHGQNLYGDKAKMPARIGRGQICWFGLKESKDLTCIIADTRRRFGDDITIGLHGESLGAATTVLALADNQDVAFAVEDCGFAELINVQQAALSWMKLPGWLVYPASVLSAIVYGYSFKTPRPVDAAEKNEVPLLVMHGTDDDFIVPKNGQQIYDASKGIKRIEYFPGAGHAASYASNPKHYEEVVYEFLDELKL